MPVPSLRLGEVRLGRRQRADRGGAGGAAGGAPPGSAAGDEDLFFMDEAEAIRQIEKEIEEQIERNHYKALGI